MRNEYYSRHSLVLAIRYLVQMTEWGKQHLTSIRETKEALEVVIDNNTHYLAMREEDNFEMVVKVIDYLGKVQSNEGGRTYDRTDHIDRLEETG